ncbi:hypothetical protein OCU04_011164 [Sclerotinia nivalis]|uniref:Malonyl-CoA:ACP transacylase (MAT) domain-containing protein n=1 Tax=Sclerotinia nivalis TaxID=352851 RepID=A0A9X0AEQ1_9HELO|nr:hypothetical protein OCU04_011164 [Sclerotinia nivalis]
MRYQFPTEAVTWPCRGLRRAFVNSFGFGGSNSHCIVDDAYHFLNSHFLVGNHNTVVDQHMCQEVRELGPQINEFTEKSIEHLPDQQLLVFSAADKDGIARLAEVYGTHFASCVSEARSINPTSFLRDLAYTLAMRRSMFTWRSFIVTNNLTDLIDLPSKISPPVRAGSSLGVAYIFTGQGAQYSKMGIDLVSFPIFFDTLKKANEVFQQLGSTWCLFVKKLIKTYKLAQEESDYNLNDPAYNQPLCTALQLGLIELLRNFGISPAIVLGHSSGEIAAA